MSTLREAATAAKICGLYAGDPFKATDAALVAWYKSLVTKHDNGDQVSRQFLGLFPQFKAMYLPKNGPGLVRDPAQVIGVGEHRAGWRVAVEALAKHRWTKIVDDFIEHSFVYYTEPPVYSAPWVGVFHHPHNMPSFAEDRQKPQFWMARREFRESLPHLKCAIVLSKYLAAWLKTQLDCPILVVKHPTDTSAPRWKPPRWTGGARLVQVGYYLRNVAAIHQVPDVPGFVRCRLRPRDKPWVEAWEGGCWRHWAEQGTRRTFPGVQDIPTVSNAEYDALLSSSVVLTEVMDSSANNVIVECIARCTPIVVNRHPAVAEYLGATYPLYFDRIEEVPALLTSDRIEAAAAYLAGIDRAFLEPERFARDVVEGLRRLGV